MRDTRRGLGKGPHRGIAKEQQIGRNESVDHAVLDTVAMSQHSRHLLPGPMPSPAQTSAQFSQQLAEHTAYLAPEGFEAELQAELGEVTASYGRLILAPGPARPVVWACNIWHQPQVIACESIGQGAKALRAMQRNWVHYPHSFHRRAALLVEKLPHVSARPLRFPEPAIRAPLGSWTLLDQHTILAAPQCSSWFPNGEVTFEQDRIQPPNRAYLKLWEALTLLDERPGEGDVCLDLGSSPGGWTWVLQSLGATVISVDKAPLDPRIAHLPGVDFRQDSAFGIDPSDLGPIDWLVCDIACYPDRLLQLIQRWLETGTCRRFICTIKLQGDTDHSAIQRFTELPNGRVTHLHHNKHELTWFGGV